MTKEFRLSSSREDWRLLLRKHELEGGDEYQAVLSHRTMDVLVKTSIKQAYFEYYETHPQDEQKAPPSNEEVELIVDAAREKLSGEPLVIAITGRSGSGKTTLAEAVMAKLHEDGRSAVILSTDDYNRGRSGLRALFGHDDHANWDAHHVYDTALMARHLEELKSGRSIPRHGFNFAESEPHELVEGDTVDPAQVIIIEGIMANSPNLKDVTDICHLVPTPLATCIGRRVMRDMQQNRGGSVANNAEDLLRYQLEVAEPEYLSRL